MTGIQARRKHFGDFLRARRAELSPEQVHLPTAGQLRRVKGLRREEVALLANVSADYYTRLEQGRVPWPSERVLSALIEALRLNADQEQYLRAITDAADRPVPGTSRSQQAVSEHMLTLFANMGPLPAMILGRYWEIHAWNSAAAELFIDFAKLLPGERNMLRLMFFDKRVRSRFKDWPSAGKTAAARLRISTAENPDDPRLLKLVNELTTRDEGFRGWWSLQRVVSDTHALRTYRHPFGGMDLVWHTLTTGAHSEHAIAVLTPSPATSKSEPFKRLMRAAAARDGGAAETAHASSSASRPLM